MADKTIFEFHQETMSSLGFWTELYKNTVIKQTELIYNTDTIREYGISDIVINGDKVLIKWFKRFKPLSDEEIKENYGR